MCTHPFDGRFEQVAEARRKLYVNRLANRRARVGLACLDANAGKVLRAFAYLGKNGVGPATLLPVDVIERQGADLVFGALVAGAGFCIQVLDFRHAEYALLDLAH